jgi:FeS assembly protein IscX
MPAIGWSNADEIGFQLHEKFPQLDPLGVGFPELRRRVLALPDFRDDPAASDEGLLEAIQMAWLEYYREGKA